MKCSGIFFFRVAFLLNYSYCIASECVIQICNYLFICLVTLNQQLERVLRTILYCIIYLFENFIFKNCRVQNKQQHVYIAMVLNCTLQCTASINVPRGCNEKKKKRKKKSRDLHRIRFPVRPDAWARDFYVCSCNIATWIAAHKSAVGTKLDYCHQRNPRINGVGSCKFGNSNRLYTLPCVQITRAFPDTHKPTKINTFKLLRVVRIAIKKQQQKYPIWSVA